MCDFFYTLDSERSVLFRTCPVLVWLGEDCDGHGDGTIVVHQANHEEQPPEDDAPVLVHDNCGEGCEHGHCHDGLTDHHPCWPVGNLAQDNIRQGGILWHILIGYDQGHCGGHHPTQQEQAEQQGLPHFI